MRTLTSGLIALLALVIISCSAPRTSSSIPPGMPAAPVPYATPAPAATSQASGKRDASGDSQAPEAASAERMIVYTVQLGVEVQDTENAANTIASIVGQYNGYIAGTTMARNSKGLMSGTLTVRVPAESLDAAQKQIEAIGKVLDRNRSSNDVTDQYTNLDARLTNLEAAEKELRDLLTVTRERTGKAEDILAVYNRLTEIRGQIEQIKGQMNVLTKTSTYATMTIRLVPHEEVQVLEPEGWLPNRTAREALRTLVQALQGLGDLVIWGALFFLPLLFVFVIPFVVIILALRALLKRRGRARAVTPASH